MKKIAYLGAIALASVTTSVWAEEVNPMKDSIPLYDEYQDHIKPMNANQLREELGKAFDKMKKICDVDTNAAKSMTHFKPEMIDEWVYYPPHSKKGRKLTKNCKKAVIQYNQVEAQLAKVESQNKDQQFVSDKPVSSPQTPGH